MSYSIKNNINNLLIKSQNNRELLSNGFMQTPDAIADHFKRRNDQIMVTINLQRQIRNLTTDPDSMFNSQQITLLFEQLFAIESRCLSRKNLSNQTFLDSGLQLQIREDDQETDDLIERIINIIETFARKNEA